MVMDHRNELVILYGTSTVVGTDQLRLLARGKRSNFSITTNFQVQLHRGGRPGLQHLARLAYRQEGGDDADGDALSD